VFGKGLNLLNGRIRVELTLCYEFLINMWLHRWTHWAWHMVYPRRCTYFPHPALYSPFHSSSETQQSPIDPKIIYTRT